MDREGVNPENGKIKLAESRLPRSSVAGSDILRAVGILSSEF
jgi:hypothetical protein